MIALAKSAIHPVTTPRDSPPNLSVVVPAAEEPRRDLVPLTFMLIACTAFAWSFAFWVLIPAIKTLLGS